MEWKATLELQVTHLTEEGLVERAEPEGDDERSGRMMRCSHLDQIQNVAPRTKGCEECLKMGDKWVHLRVCLECGHVGCCDSSKNKHATKHFHETSHPIMKSMEPGENWGWCYVDQMMLDLS